MQGLGHARYSALWGGQRLREVWQGIWADDLQSPWWLGLGGRLCCWSLLQVPPSKCSVYYSTSPLLSYHCLHGNWFLVRFPTNLIIDLMHFCIQHLLRPFAHFQSVLYCLSPALVRFVGHSSSHFSRETTLMIRKQLPKSRTFTITTRTPYR